MKKFTVGAGRVWALDYTPDGGSLVVQEGRADQGHAGQAPVRAVRWWNWREGKEERNWWVPGPVTFSPDHRLVALAVSNDSRLTPDAPAEPMPDDYPTVPCLQDARTLCPVRGVRLMAGWLEFAFASDCSVLAQALYRTDDRVFLERTRVPAKYQVEPSARPVVAAPVAFSPGGDRVAMVDCNGVEFLPTEEAFEADPEDYAGPDLIVLGRNRWANALLYLNEGTLLVLEPPPGASAGPHIAAAAASLWSVSSMKEMAPPFAKAGPLRTAALSANRRLLVVGGGTTVRMWDAKTWAQLSNYNWDIGEVSAVAFSPDGQTCAAGGEKGRVVVWDVEA